MHGKFWIVCGALLAATGVAAGAMGAHFLKESLHLPQSDLDTYDTAVRYQIYHALGLILVGLLAARARSRLLHVGGAALLLGCVLFSGGIYAWIGTGIRPFVHVVPIGGTAWIVGWLLVAVGVAVAKPLND
jgi:uncharacterized membrane protein YgdD (TMEM256/DUF423 family)